MRIEDLDSVVTTGEIEDIKVKGQKSENMLDVSTRWHSKQNNQRRDK